MKATEKNNTTFRNREGGSALLRYLASQKYPGNTHFNKAEPKLGGNEAAAWVALTYSSVVQQTCRVRGGHKSPLIRTQKRPGGSGPPGHVMSSDATLGSGQSYIISERLKEWMDV